MIFNKKLGIIILILVLFIVICILFVNWSGFLLSQKYLHPFYRKVLNGRSNLLHTQYKTICEKYNIKPQRILDFGCGFGGLGHKLRKNGNKVVSLDIVDHYIYDDKDDLHIIPRLEKDSDMLPFNSNSFDVVVSSYCFHHIPIEQHKRLLNELQRVANTIILLEEHPSRNLLCRFLNSEMLTHANAHMTYNDWKIHLEKMNFSVNIYELNSIEFGLVITK